MTVIDLWTDAAMLADVRRSFDARPTSAEVL